MSVLDQIIARKKIEVAEAKDRLSFDRLQRFIKPADQNLSLKQHLLALNKTGIIAEFKKGSPSKGIINDKVTPQEVTRGYELAGASACSVLTDKDFFFGSEEDLKAARGAVHIPLLRKDFMIDEYQILEAKAWGANIILLIAACLTPADVKRLAKFAHATDLEVLLEVHNKKELLDNLIDEVDVIGVNNRNLKTFEVSIDNSLQLAELIPTRYVKISESGLDRPEDLITLEKAGYKGFLMGERFMKEKDPGKAMMDFVKKYEALKK
ncbi:MAG TPA: indole-3-glycerol phosphate synthase TrpC [Cytophagaceae bacterium]|jgi:indole-3-glycerol phosphate synthase|nr:indole-3-glycerol phosphate synthase TrpC [Cytophagaceae bacterium]